MANSKNPNRNKRLFDRGSSGDCGKIVIINTWKPFNSTSTQYNNMNIYNISVFICSSSQKDTVHTHMHLVQRRYIFLWFLWSLSLSFPFFFSCCMQVFHQTPFLSLSLFPMLASFSLFLCLGSAPPSSIRKGAIRFSRLIHHTKVKKKETFQRITSYPAVCLPYYSLSQLSCFACIRVNARAGANVLSCATCKQLWLPLLFSLFFAMSTFNSRAQTKYGVPLAGPAAVDIYIERGRSFVDSFPRIRVS